MAKLAIVLLCALTGVAALPRGASAKADAFPFVIPWNDAARTAIDVSDLNPAPLDESRRITIRGDHFYDATGRRVRFVGTNFAAGACFPQKEDAAAVAARLHKYGFNCVRLHHMDSGWADPNMFSISGGSYGKRTDQLDPESLDRLDYLIYQFKLHGIYVDINLHVGRGFNEA
ncbi:MAG: glycoside hydrolase family 5 protein, partial [Armatimonadetes bacterium]|nr:glycoside hydrolase family 5 protein [Armatimonadota bacterium]